MGLNSEKEVDVIRNTTSRIVAALLLTGAVVTFASIITPTGTSALPSYAPATGQACGVCHVNPAGGGPRTIIGQAFAAVPTHASDPAGAWALVSSPTPTPTPIPTQTPTPTAAPPLAILPPTEGQIVTSTVTVRVQVTNFNLAPGAIGGANNPGEGHWHILVDGSLIQPVGTESVNLAGLALGQHTIKADLHNNDHSPVTPLVESTIHVTVAAAISHCYLPYLPKGLDN